MKHLFWNTRGYWRSPLVSVILLYMRFYLVTAAVLLNECKSSREVSEEYMLKDSALILQVWTKRMQSSTMKLKVAALGTKALKFNLKGILLEVRTIFLLRKT